MEVDGDGRSTSLASKDNWQVRKCTRLHLWAETDLLVSRYYLRLGTYITKIFLTIIQTYGHGLNLKHFAGWNYFICMEATFHPSRVTSIFFTLVRSVHLIVMVLSSPGSKDT